MEEFYKCYRCGNLTHDAHINIVYHKGDVEEFLCPVCLDHLKSLNHKYGEISR